MGFTLVSKDLGYIKVARKQQLKFPYKDINIDRIEVSCDCTGARDDKENHRVIVEYTPKPIPEHLKTQGYYITQKTITVHSDKGVFILTFNAKVQN